LSLSEPFPVYHGGQRRVDCDPVRGDAARLRLSGSNQTLGQRRFGLCAAVGKATRYDTSMNHDYSPTLSESPHPMHCPHCGMSLQRLKHGHVDVDMCLSCKGIWLDEERLKTLLGDQKFGRQLVNSVLNIFKRKSFWG
jgi:hypothetical protein